MGKKRVGVFHLKNRNWYRNITRHSHDDYEFRRYHDVCRVANAIRRRIVGGSKFLGHSRIPPSYPLVDLFHHWRLVDFGYTPWIVTSSNGIPFGWPIKWYAKGFDLLASDACKRILLTSNYALDHQRHKLNLAEVSDHVKSTVLGKVEVVPPTQPTLITEWGKQQGDPTNKLRLAFVGGLFFLKGGLEMLRVVQRLVSEGANISLQVVSSLATTAQTGDSEEDVQEAYHIMEKCPGITWHGKLPNHEVLNIFRRSHIGLLPSYADAYGYTVLEAQAAGCATITTDIKTFPEINPDSVGWRVGIDGDDYDFRTPEGRALISKRLEHGLYRILTETLEQPYIIQEKGRAAIKRIKNEHDPERHRARLQSIYDQALR